MFGEILKELRSSRGLTQQELGNAIGVSQLAISSWERGTRRPDIDTVSTIARYFEVPIDELLGHTEKVPHSNDTGLSEFMLLLLKKHPEYQNMVIEFSKLTPEQAQRVIGYLQAVKETPKG